MLPSRSCVEDIPSIYAIIEPKKFEDERAIMHRIRSRPSNQVTMEAIPLS